MDGASFLLLYKQFGESVIQTLVDPNRDYIPRGTSVPCDYHSRTVSPGEESGYRGSAHGSCYTPRS